MELSGVRVAVVAGMNEYDAEEIKNLDKAINDTVATKKLSRY